MPRRVSLMMLIAHHGHGVGGVRPETTAALEALSSVERQFGIVKALEGALSAWMSTMGTMGAKDPALFDSAIETLLDGAERLKESKKAIASGTPLPSGAVAKLVRIVGEPEGSA